MNDKIKELLEKYNPESLFQTVLENYDSSKIHPGSFVVLDPELLKNQDIRKELTIKKGATYLAQLDKMAADKHIMFVSALKTLRTTSGYLSEAPSSHPEEADLVNHKVPGLYTGIITVPCSILKTVTEAGNIMQHPIDDQFVAKVKHEKGATLDNEYNKGKQPKGTVNNGGNN